MKKLLNGITVLSLEQAVAAPFCTAKLADAGARVIKVERKGVGDFARYYDKNAAGGASSYFSWLNRGKESFEADIKNEQDKSFLIDMVKNQQVDVFVQNLAPGAAARAGFGSKELRKLNDRLITLDMTGYGEEGPRANYKAYDLLVAAEAGLCTVTGTPDGPGRVGVSICDITAGMNGYSAILQGLFQRERTGEGSSYSVSLFHTIAEIMNVPLIQQKYTGTAPKRVGLSHPSIAPYGAFDSSDGKKVLISIQNEREWKTLCAKVLGNENLASDARFESATKRVENRIELDQIIQGVFQTYPASELTKTLLDSGIAFGELSSVQGLVEHPQLQTIEYNTENGDPISIAAPAIRPGPRDVGPVPKLGEHTQKIRKDFAGKL